VTFSLSVTLEVTGRRTVVVGGGYEAVDRVEALLRGGADVVVVTPAPDPPLLAHADAGRITLHRRGYRPGDLAGAFVAYVTREDPTDVEATWDEATRERVLLSTLDDVPHCHFATPSVMRRGDLAVTIATMGRAPALAKRLRRHLEDEFGPELGDLVDVLEAAKQACSPRPVPFDEWAARWELALADLDGLLTAVRQGRRAEAQASVERALRTPSGTVLAEEVTA
jgi:precorrin-2 dehydrogenase / sirohydrochlorin ferrochelatase